jgi:hypothetical protein
MMQRGPAQREEPFMWGFDDHSQEVRAPAPYTAAQFGLERVQRLGLATTHDHGAVEFAADVEQLAQEGVGRLDRHATKTHEEWGATETPDPIQESCLTGIRPLGVPVSGLDDLPRRICRWIRRERSKQLIAGQQDPLRGSEAGQTHGPLQPVPAPIVVQGSE